jgi:hypothetical protein
MNAIRKLLCVAGAGLAVTFALPGIAAPTKTYSINAQETASYHNDSTTGLQVLDVPMSVVVTMKNESPPSVANSNISSFSFTVSGMTIESVDTLSCQNQGGNCNLDTNSNTVSVTGISPPIQGQGVFAVPVKVTSCGDGNWSAKVWSGSQLNGNMFGLVNDTTLPTKPATNVVCGGTSCGNTFTVPVDQLSSNVLSVTGIRGDFNKDGSACSVLNYTVTNTIPQNDTLHFEWDTSVLSAAFKYTINFRTATQPPQLAWLTDSNGPVPVAAQACLPTGTASNLPAPFGFLAQAVAGNKNKIQVNVTVAPTLPLPFPIVIGTERMNVTAISNNNWTVQRGQGGTTASAHGAGDPVMATPLPILPAGVPKPYVAGYQAQACIASPLPPSTWPSLTYDVIDIGDAWTFGK